ncbi:MAG TPA: hypothetical protein VIL86_01725 [Tepidisphaeraceae bacterium]
MKRRMLTVCCGILSILLLPALTFARVVEEKEIVDARLEGYSRNVTLADSTTSLIWLLFIFLAALALGVLFRNAKRTHLD